MSIGSINYSNPAVVQERTRTVNPADKSMHQEQHKAAEANAKEQAKASVEKKQYEQENISEEKVNEIMERFEHLRGHL